MSRLLLSGCGAISDGNSFQYCVVLRIIQPGPKTLRNILEIVSRVASKATFAVTCKLPHTETQHEGGLGCLRSLHRVTQVLSFHSMLLLLHCSDYFGGCADDSSLKQSRLPLL